MDGNFKKPPCITIPEKVNFSVSSIPSPYSDFFISKLFFHTEQVSSMFCIWHILCSNITTRLQYKVQEARFSEFFFKKVIRNQVLLLTALKAGSETTSAHPNAHKRYTGPAYCWSVLPPPPHPTLSPTGFWKQKHHLTPTPSHILTEERCTEFPYQINNHGIFKLFIHIF